MKRYESYKDSGVKWLGEIPGHWEVIRLKALLIERIEKNNNKENLIILSLLKDKGIIPYDEKGAIGNNSKEDLSQYKIARKGDLVINSMNVIIGSVGITQYDGYISPAYYSFKPKGIINLIYYYYLMTLRSVQQSIRCYSKGIMEIRLRITSNDFLSMPFPFPPKSEQTAIANYLNSVTSKIDEAISQQQKMIDLLNERKQIIIQNAVTKGLDPNAKMKDSGVEWIGEIPENWEVIKCSYVFSGIGSGTTPKSSNEYYYTNEGVNFLQTGDLNDGYINDTTKKITDKALKEINLKIYSKNSLIIAMYGATIGKLGILNVCTTVNQACCVLPQTKKISIKYAFYMYMIARKDLIIKSRGGGQPNISQDTIRNQKIIVPTKNDQEEIVEHIEKMINPIDSSISQCNKMISLLQERKQIIINDVVTGKVKVI